MNQEPHEWDGTGRKLPKREGGREDQDWIAHRLRTLRCLVSVCPPIKIKNEMRLEKVASDGERETGQQLELPNRSRRHRIQSGKKAKAIRTRTRRYLLLPSYILCRLCFMLSSALASSIVWSERSHRAAPHPRPVRRSCLHCARHGRAGAGGGRVTAANPPHLTAEKLPRTPCGRMPWV